MLFPYSFLISHSCSPTSFMVGRSSRVGAAHWNAKLRSFSSTSSSTWSSSNGSNISLMFPSLNFLKVCIPSTKEKSLSYSGCHDSETVKTDKMPLLSQKYRKGKRSTFNPLIHSVYFATPNSQNWTYPTKTALKLSHMKKGWSFMFTISKKHVPSTKRL